MHTKKGKLILVDGSSYLHRAFHALPALSTLDGMPTGAIYGVVSMLKKMLSTYSADYVAVVFDAKGKNFRHKLYPEYKATRPPMEEALQVQIQPLHEIIQAMGIPLLVVPEVEADDVIGTLARMAAAEGIDTIISTGDKDLAQLVTSNITLINTMTNTTLDISGVKAKFGVTPEQIVDYLTLVGDSSDNICGIEGVGPKTAAKWLAEYETLDNLLKHQDAIGGKVGERLREGAKRLPLVKQLVTIRDDLQLDISLKGLELKEQDTLKLQQIFTKLEFRNWLEELTNKDKEQQKSSQQETQYPIILTLEDLNRWLAKLQQAIVFAFDTETTGLDITQAKLVGISLAVGEGDACYIPLAHSYAGAPQQLSITSVIQALRPIFTDKNKIKLGQNIKYDINILSRYGLELCTPFYDTMIESYILNSAHNQHNKETLAFRYLGKTIASYSDIVGKGAKQVTFDKISLVNAACYAAFDADLVIQLHKVMWQHITHTSSLQRVLQEIDMPLVTVLAKMERHGVMVDVKKLNAYSQELGTKLQQLEQKIYHEVQQEFNINSPQQLQEILYTKLKIPVVHKTPKGQPSTAEEALQELALDYRLPQMILDYRSINKLKSTYTDALPIQISSKTGRIHTSYNQTVTTTGRLSSTEPNLQNIPVRTEEGRLIRQAFVAPRGYKLIAADYSQIELRIMAHLAQDKNLLAAFKAGQDIHRMVASEIFGIEPERVTENERRHAKTINFGLIYGMSAFGLAKRIGMERETAEQYINLYFARYPGVKAYMEKMRAFARQHGFIESIFGRRVYTPEIKTKHYNRRMAAERAAINAPIQGSAADIMKLAMIDIDRWLAGSAICGTMIMQVHDELIFEVLEKDVEVACYEIKSRMERAGEAACQIATTVNIGIGDNWDEAH